MQHTVQADIYKKYSHTPNTNTDWTKLGKKVKW